MNDVISLPSIILALVSVVALAGGARWPPRIWSVALLVLGVVLFLAAAVFNGIRL